MIQIFHIPGLQYAGETPEQAEERDRRIIEANERLREKYDSEQRQRIAPMACMKEWAAKHGVRQHNAALSGGDRERRHESTNED